MEGFDNLFLQAVEGEADTFAFRFDFVPEGKSVDADVVTELDDGDLLIEGWAARFDGIDRQNENFAPGAFERGIKTFLEGQAALCFQHNHSKVLGKVLELQEEEGKGLRLKARVDGAIRNHPELGTLYEQIKKGTINALSVGGFFRRGNTSAGKRITDMDFTEISTTAVPVHPETSFAVIAGKALQMGEGDTTSTTHVEIEADDDAAQAELAAAAGLVQRFETLFDGLGGKALPPNYDAAAANRLAGLLRCLSKLRSEATYSQDTSDDSNQQVNDFADQIESVASQWEADAHRLAAEIGPLPDLGGPVY